MKVAVFGLGYVGSVTAACLAANGHDVWGVDVDTAKVDPITEGRSPVVEPGLDELMANGVAAGRLHATTDPHLALEGADVSLICVGTPSTASGSTDLTYIRRAVQDIAAAAKDVAPPDSGFHSIVIRSTVPPGTVDDVVGPALAGELSTGGFTFGTAMCPEFLREGSGLADFFAPPFVVVGTADARVGDALTELFGFLPTPVQVVDVRTAEALKYACNAFHATKVSFANEMGRIFRFYGVDSRQVMEIFCQDTSLNISPYYLRPGFAFGGSCLPKDLRSVLHLARTNDTDLPLLAGTLATNELIVRDVVDRVLTSPGREVALLGLSFKTATDDLRESPSVELAERLIGKGYNLRIYDSIVNPSRLVGANKRHVESKLPHLQRVLTGDPVEALRGADLALVSTTDAEAVEALLSHPPARTIDLSGRLGAQVEALAGYEGVGW
ncbi:GDP-mannose 6-dehydrogenase [Kribbella orskensis]|uniref:UDP-glucose 6-dehydrogenase n=1 Tax=Kribbella orskensis TaxID=2512216 RepID=A0ABY2BSH2_9ACTN|nr:MULTISPECIES: UDP-glucose/GDP-mannose dehydrogenase family protein [Kribbella]TCM44209.1 GDP-mannose 6-dehydrogenase [Kribbella sp. VKM Ac-2568]TCN42793.1 GDP-mannose 6-dehydrogenase [Kribbella sp. VKM Ac-2500]TCO29851.1 GDP-mannose 6-dehydrogenase [Kribbella orskensis]